MTEAIAKIDTIDALQELSNRPTPREIIAAATEEADVLAGVIEKQRLYSVIQSKKFVRVEGWVTLATLRGCLPREVEVVEMPEGRYVATVELIRMSDGMVLTRASAECGGDGDSVWRGRPSNARRSMAITRATGKACRVAFSWVMALSGYEVTPAEEMDHVAAQNDNPAPRRDWPAKGVPAPSVADQREANRADAGPPVWRGKLVNVETKTGTNKSGPWTLYLFIGQDGEKFGTFYDTVSAGLLKLEGRFVEIVYEPTSKGGKNIVEYRDVTAEEVPL